MPPFKCVPCTASFQRTQKSRFYTQILITYARKTNRPGRTCVPLAMDSRLFPSGRLLSLVIFPRVPEFSNSGSSFVNRISRNVTRLQNTKRQTRSTGIYQSVRSYTANLFDYFTKMSSLYKSNHLVSRFEIYISKGFRDISKIEL